MKKIFFMLLLTLTFLFGIDSVKAATMNASIKDDTGKWVEFKSGNTAKLGMKNGIVNVYEVKISLVFDDNSKNKQVVVNLKEGINLIDSGQNLLSGVLNGKVVQSEQSKNILESGYNAKNGKLVYNFTDLTVSATILLKIAPDVVLDIENITDSINIQLFQNKKTTADASASINTSANLNEIPIKIDGNNNDINTLLDIKAPIVTYARIGGLGIFDLENNIVYSKLFKYIKIYVTVPKNVQYKGNSSYPSGYSTYSEGGWNLVSKKEGINTDEYVFQKNNIVTYKIGISPEWLFPSTSFKDGDKITINAIKVEYETYGKNNKISDTIDYKNIFTISNKEIITLSPNNSLIRVAKPNRLDDIIPFGYVNFKNSGAIDSTEKEIVYTFDDANYGITNVFVPANKDTGIKEVWYQTKNKNGEISLEKSVKIDVKEFQDRNTFNKIYPYHINKSVLGITDEDTYIYKLRYKVGVIPANDSTFLAAYVFKFFGKRLKAAGEYTTKIELKDVNGSNTTGIRTSKAKIDGNYYFSDGVNASLNKKQIINSGDTVSFTYRVLYIDHDLITVNGYTPNPVYYIRSETGLPITNLKLIGNDDKTNIIDQCIISDPYKTSDGALIYKIDTKNVKNNLAAIGLYIADYKRMALTFDIQTPIDYSDGGKLHDFSTTLFITNENTDGQSIISALNRYLTNLNGDPFDVNNNSKTDDVMHYDIPKGIFYQIKSSGDVDVYSYIKKSSEKDENYKYYNDNKEPLNITNSDVLNVKTSIANNSGVTVNSNETYIPIPKSGDTWGSLSYESSKFQFDMILNSKIDNPDSTKNKIYYCIANSTNNLSELRNLKCKEDISEEEFSKINLIKIVTNDLKSEDKYDFYFDLSIPKKLDASKVNTFRPIYFRNLTNKDGEIKSGWVYSKYLSVKLKGQKEDIVNPRTGKILYIIPIILIIISTTILYYISNKRVKNI